MKGVQKAMEFPAEGGDSQERWPGAAWRSGSKFPWETDARGIDP